jgi:putative oxidoreductase
MEQLDAALLVVRLVFGITLACHGYNKVFGAGGLAGTAGFFGSIGMRWPWLQARLAAGTEIGAGLLFAAGLLTPFAAAGIIGLMAVATWAVHRGNGLFVFNQGWEYTASIAVVAWAIATIGPGEYSLDEVLDLSWSGWTGALIAGLLGLGAAAVQLAICYRPPAPAPSA